MDPENQNIVNSYQEFQQACEYNQGSSNGQQDLNSLFTHELEMNYSANSNQSELEIVNVLKMPTTTASSDLRRNKAFQNLSISEKKQFATANLQSFLAHRGIQLSIVKTSESETERQPQNQSLAEMDLPSTDSFGSDPQHHNKFQQQSSSQDQFCDNNGRSKISAMEHEIEEDVSNLEYNNAIECDNNRIQFCTQSVHTNIFPVTSISLKRPHSKTSQVKKKLIKKKLIKKKQKACPTCSRQFKSIIDLNLQITPHSVQPENTLNHLDFLNTENKVALPLVDLKEPNALKALRKLGIEYCIPLTKIPTSISDALGISNQIEGTLESAENSIPT